MRTGHSGAGRREVLKKKWHIKSDVFGGLPVCIASHMKCEKYYIKRRPLRLEGGENLLCTGKPTLHDGARHESAMIADELLHKSCSGHMN